MEQKTKKIILISIAAVAGTLLLAALVFYVFFQSQFTVYQDTTHGFSVKYPKDWQKLVAPQPGAAVVFISPKETALDVFLENVNISIEPLPEGISNVQGLSEQIILQMTQVFGNMQITGKKAVTFGGRKGYAMVFAVEKPRAMRILNVLTVIGAKNAYVFTYMSMGNRYKTYLPLVTEMIRSFRFDK